MRAELAPGCGPEPSSLAIQLEALGDFEASTLTSDSAPGDAKALPLEFPAATRAVSALAQGGGKTYLGTGARSSEGGIDFLLWRRDEACAPWPAPALAAPAEARGVALGLLPGQHTVLAAGALVPSTDAARAFTFDLATGASNEVLDGMLPGRAHASITAFGTTRLLVAGGVDPSLSPGDVEAAPPIDSATVFDAETLRFDRGALIPLSQPRARHAALLLDSGETLLIGGSGPNGTALSTLEAISPTDRAARVAGLTTLARARVAPTALELSDGRIFIGGGTNAGTVVHALEWLDADATSLTLIQENVVLSPGAAFAKMPGGGVLGVGVCVPKQVSACSGTAPSSKVVWIRADGALDELPDLSTSPERVALVDGTDGAPWLLSWTAGSASWKRFDPWTGLFDEVPEHPSSAPDVDLAAPVAVEPGLFLWLERAGNGSALLGFRHGVRGKYTRDVAPLLLSSREHVAPSRAPLGFATSGIAYDSDGLALSGPEVSAWVTDTSYENVTLELTLTSGTPPAVRLGGVDVGGSDCPWPETKSATSGEVMLVRRRGTEATLKRGGESLRCSVPPGRLDVALVGTAAGVSRVRSLALRRE